MRTLIDFLPQASNLRELSLDGCQGLITTKIAEILGRTKIDMLSLQDVDMNGFDVDFFLETAPTVKMKPIDISFNGEFDDSTVAHIEQFLSANSGLVVRYHSN